MNKKYIIAIVLIVIGLVVCLLTEPYINLDEVKIHTTNIEEKI